MGCGASSNNGGESNKTCTSVPVRAEKVSPIFPAAATASAPETQTTGPTTPHWPDGKSKPKNARAAMTEDIVKKYGLIPEDSLPMCLWDLNLIHSKDCMHALMQRQLLFNLGVVPGGDTFHIHSSEKLDQVLTSAVAKTFLASYPLLELFLTSGDCVVISKMSDPLSHNRWLRALETMLRFVAHDTHLTEGREDELDVGLRMRLAVGASLANSSPIVLLDAWEKEDKAPDDKVLGL